MKGIDLHGTPDSPNKYLLKEAGCDQVQVAWYDVGRYDSSTKNASHHHCRPTPSERAEVADSGAAEDCAQLSNHCNDYEVCSQLL